MEHNLFKAQTFEEGKHQVAGDCNGFTMQQRWDAETPEFAKKILSFVNDEKSKILDYGVGVGRLAKEILKQNDKVFITGIDASQGMLNQAEKYIADYNFIPLLPFDIGKDKFDLVYCVYVLQHVSAIEIREILSRIYNHLKNDGFFIYCSSNYRMSIRFDGKGFFDDSFLGVNLQEEVERYFDKVKPLFTPEELEVNPILKKMITGCDNGLAHPAFVYRKKVKADTINILKKQEKEIYLPKKLLLINRLSPGDILVMTNAIRDLHLAYPNKFITDVRTPCPDIFVNNPYITKLNYDEIEYNKINTWFASNVGKTKMLNDIMCVDMQYPLIHQSGARGAHFAEGHREFLEDTLKIKIPQTKIRPEIYLSGVEKSIPQVITNKYWIINSGSKSDYTLKQYPYYQEVVDLLKDKIQFVQIGVKSHNHQPLNGVTDMVGKTDNLRDLFKLIYHAEGVLTCISLPMHISAAFKKPCVVVAGAREGTRWELYPNHRFIYVNGCLPCADYDGCWRSRIEDCNIKKNGIPKCMTLINPEEVAREIEKYYLGGVLKYDITEPVILNLKGEDKMNDTITTGNIDKKELDSRIKEGYLDKNGVLRDDFLDLRIKKDGNMEILMSDFPIGINSPQVNSAIFNILRILKQVTSSDNYLEAYQWHYNKRKEKFMDIYHFMNWLGANVRPKRILEIGSRTGISICQLLSAYLNYDEIEKIILCDTFQEAPASPQVVLNALKYLNIPVDKVEFIVGDSLAEIPKLIGKQTFSSILVDGNHAKDYARKDLENAVQLIEKDGYIILDDISQDGCSLDDIWQQFKEINKGDFIFSEDYEGKGLAIAKRIS